MEKHLPQPEWGRLSQKRRKRAVWRIRLLSVYQKFSPVAWVFRLGTLHGGITMLTLAAFPPAPEVPAVAVPIVWAASFCTAVTVMAVAPAFRL